MNKMIIFATATMIGCGDKDTGSESDDSATDTNTAADDTSAPISMANAMSLTGRTQLTGTAWASTGPLELFTSELTILIPALMLIMLVQLLLMMLYP